MDSVKKYNSNSKNTDRKKVKFKHQLFVYLFFLFISIIFWYLNALGKDYNTEFNFPLQYQNLPKGKVLANDLPANITIEVRGNGFQLLRYKLLSFVKKVKLDVNSFSPYLKSRNNEYYLTSNYLQGYLKGHFKNIQINQVYPDTLMFYFTTVIDKRLPVKPVLSLKFAESYMLSGTVRAIPDSITISGPKALIDTMHLIFSEFKQVKDIKDTVFSSVKLEQLPKFIYPMNEVKLLIPAEKYTEIVYSIPVTVVNVPQGIEIKTFPATINVSFDVTLSKFDKINSGQFKIVADYNDINNLDASKKLKILLSKMPASVVNVKYSPKSVEYIALKW